MATLVAHVCNSITLHLKAKIARRALMASKGKAALAVTIVIAAMEAMQALVEMVATTAMAVKVAIGDVGIHAASYVENGVMRR
jgi:hypothetical protein